MQSFQEFQVDNQVLKSVLEFCKRIETVKAQETAKAILNLLGAGKSELHPFGIVKLLNLAVQDVEEMKSLIPSLNENTTYEYDKLVALIKNMECLLS